MTVSVEGVEEQLGMVTRSFRQHWCAAAAELHPQLQPLGYGLLIVLTKAGPQSMSAVAERMAVEKSVLSRLVRHLESLDLIQVSVDPADGRARVLSIPAAVAQAVAQRRRLGFTAVREELGSWTPEELGTFDALLRRLLPDPGAGLG